MLSFVAEISLLFLHKISTVILRLLHNCRIGVLCSFMFYQWHYVAIKFNMEAIYNNILICIFRNT